MERELDAVEWSVEPRETLAELYRQRAEEIRARYDWVAVAYSGGHDSTNVVETFHYGGLRVDEYVCVGALSQDTHAGSDEHQNAELHLNVYPTLRELGLAGRMRVLDYAERLEPGDLSLVKEHGPEWYKHVGARYSLHHLFWRDVPGRLGGDGGAALVFGVDKPWLRHDGRRFYTLFSDTSLATYGNWYAQGRVDRINFYTDPRSPKIMVKQLHVMARLYAERVLSGRMTLGEWLRREIDMVHSAVYDLKHPLRFQTHKPSSSIISPRDAFLLRNRSSSVYGAWKEGVDRMVAESGAVRKFHSVPTKRYYLDIDPPSA